MKKQIKRILASLLAVSLVVSTGTMTTSAETTSGKATSTKNISNTLTSTKTLPSTTTSDQFVDSLSVNLYEDSQSSNRFQTYSLLKETASGITLQEGDVLTVEADVKFLTPSSPAGMASRFGFNLSGENGDMADMLISTGGFYHRGVNSSGGCEDKASGDWSYNWRADQTWHVKVTINAYQSVTLEADHTPDALNKTVAWNDLYNARSITTNTVLKPTFLFMSSNAEVSNITVKKLGEVVEGLDVNLYKDGQSSNRYQTYPLLEENASGISLQEGDVLTVEADVKFLTPSSPAGMASRFGFNLSGENGDMADMLISTGGFYHRGVNSSGGCEDKASGDWSYNWSADQTWHVKVTIDAYDSVTLEANHWNTLNKTVAWKDLYNAKSISTDTVLKPTFLFMSSNAEVSNINVTKTGNEEDGGEDNPAFKPFDPEKNTNAAEYETLTTSGETKYQNGLTFGASNTYYYSGDIDYGEGLDYGNGYSGEMGVYFIIGKALIGTEEYPILAEHRPASSATRVYVKGPNEEITLGPDSIWRGDLWHRQKYHYDVAWKNGTVSFYVDGNAIVEKLDIVTLLTAQDFTSVIPSPGIMAKALPQKAVISNIKIWGDVIRNPEKITELNNFAFVNGEKVIKGNGLVSLGGETYAIKGYTVGEGGEVRELTADFKFSSAAPYSGVGFQFGTLTDNQGEKHKMYLTLQQTTYGTGLRWMLYEDGLSDGDLISFDTYWSENFALDNTYTLKVSCQEQKLQISVNGNEVLNKNITALSRPANRNGGSYQDFAADTAELVLGPAVGVTNVKMSGIGLSESEYEEGGGEHNPAFKPFDPATDTNVAEYETLTTKSETRYQNGLTFGSSNTWYYSGDIDYGEGLNYDNGGYNGEMGVYFIIGTALIGEEEYPILAEHRPASSATRVYVKGPNGEITLGPDNIWRGDLYHQQKYHYDVAWESGKVSFYVNNSAVVEALDLEAKLVDEIGFDTVIPSPGIMAKGLPQEAVISNIKIWGDVTIKREVITEADDLTFDNGSKIMFGQGVTSPGGESYVVSGYTVSGTDSELRELSADFKFSQEAVYSGIGFRFGTLTDDQGKTHEMYLTLQQTTYDTGLRWMLYEDGRSDKDLIEAGTYWNENFDLKNTYTLKVHCKEEKLSVSLNGNEMLSKKITALNRPANRSSKSYVTFAADKTGLIFDTAASATNVKVNGIGVAERLNLGTMENGTVTISCDRTDLSGGTKVVVIPKPAKSYSVLAGSLKYETDSSSHFINNIDEKTGGCVFTMPKENATLHCAFSKDSEQNVSIAVIGASLEKTGEETKEYTGIRFLVRMALPDTNKSPIGQKVVYEGKEYTIKDYGTLSAKAKDYETRGDAALKKVSQAEIRDITKDFADYVITYRNVGNTNTEYVVKGYLELDPVRWGKTVTVKTDLYSGSIASAKDKMQ